MDPPNTTTLETKDSPMDNASDDGVIEETVEEKGDEVMEEVGQQQQQPQQHDDRADESTHSPPVVASNCNTSDDSGNLDHISDAGDDDNDGDGGLENDTVEHQGSPVADVPPVAPVDPLAEIPVVLKAVDTLRSAISEVIAFPTEVTYSKLLTHAKAAHDSYHHLGTRVELGEKVQEESSSSTQNQNPVLDAQSRSKFNANGTNLWNTIQKHPELFVDSLPDQQKVSASTDLTASQNGLERDRGAASGYIRALACRLILISKIHTCVANSDTSTNACATSTVSDHIPQLVMTEMTASNTAATDADKSSTIRVPSALSSELEFGLKCLSRAGRAMLLHEAPSTSSHHHYESAFSTLSFALVCWDGIQKSNAMNHLQSFPAVDNQGGDGGWVGADHVRADAFDAHLLLPDCASKLKLSHLDTSGKDSQVKNEYFPSSQLVILQLQKLEDFVNETLPKSICSAVALTPSTPVGGNGEKKNKDHALSTSSFAAQHYLPSLARVGFKHGNRFARLQDYTAAREALRISLTASDKCIEKIRREQLLSMTDDRHYDKDNRKSVVGHSSQVQEQEMIVVSKQSFHILSHVCRSVEEFEEAAKCLDRIETYIDEQNARDDELYKQTIATLSSKDRTSSTFRLHSSSFVLEGPQMQDAEDIKTRAQSARAKARELGCTERIDLAFSRIDLRQKVSSIMNDEDEKFIDSQFKIMLECTKKSSHNANEICSSAPSNPSEPSHAHKLILTAARLISTRRLLASNEDQSHYKRKDPYSSYSELFSNTDINQVNVYLEDIHTTIMAAKSARAVPVGREATQHLDRRGINIGQHLISKLRIFSVSTAKSESTLFGGQVNLSNKFTHLLERARDFCTKALSLYQGQEECSEQTLEWCDILLHILEMSRETNVSSAGGVAEIQYDKIVAGVMAIKAFTLSQCRSFGIALKLAREAWKKDGTELGTMITLFHCALNYETFSKASSDNVHDSDIPDVYNYTDTLLEFDSATNDYESLSKLHKTSDINHLQRLFDVYPLLCKFALDRKVLLLGLQRRMLEISIKVTTHMISHDFDKISNEIKNKRFNVFSILRAYLATVEELLETVFYAKEKLWQMDQLLCLQSTLEKTLNLLVLLRDSSMVENGRDRTVVDGDDSSFPVSITKTETSRGISYRSLFDLTAPKMLLGKQTECLWIAEQLWNISNQIMSAEIDDKIKLEYSQFIAKYLIDAHDFALLSEEEAHTPLTKGHLGHEHFNEEAYDSVFVEFGSKAFKATDLCSEFSVQCLLSSVASTVDRIISAEAQVTLGEDSQLMIFALKCLVVAKAELTTLGMENDRADETIVFLSLNLLIAMRDDESCLNALNEGGLLKKLKMDVLLSRGDRPSRVIGLRPLEHLYILANRANFFGMQITAKTLFSICVNEMIRTQKDFIINRSNTIGLIHRIMINLQSSVSEVVATFHSINMLMEKKKSSTGKNYPTYSSEDLDFLVVEAHNRACSLIFIGDTKHAEKLLTVALNLLPHCSKEVENYGPEIHRAYRGVLGNQNSLSLTTSDDLMDLLKS